MDIARFLFNFSYKRKVLEAIGFYFSHVIISIVAGAIIGAVVGALFDISLVVLIALVLTVIYSSTITGLTVHQKHLSSSYYMFVILSGILALILGTIGGLLPATVLLTRNSADDQ